MTNIDSEKIIEYVTKLTYYDEVYGEVLLNPDELIDFINNEVDLNENK